MIMQYDIQKQEFMKTNDVIEEANSSITNPPKGNRIKFCQSAPRDTTYNLEGRYLIDRGNYNGQDKDYKTYGKTKPINGLEHC